MYEEIAREKKKDTWRNLVFYFNYISRSTYRFCPNWLSNSGLVI